MKNKWFVIGVIATVLGITSVLVIGTTASAQGPVAPGWGMGRGGMLGIGGPQNSLVAIAAKTLNMDYAALVTELQAGKSIADVSKSKGVSTDKIANDFIATRSQALKIAVDSKWITQAQADAMLAYMKSHVAEELTQVRTARGFVPGVTAPNSGVVCPLCGANPQTPTFGPRGRQWR